MWVLENIHLNETEFDWQEREQREERRSEGPKDGSGVEALNTFFSALLPSHTHPKGTEQIWWQRCCKYNEMHFKGI